MMADFVDEHVGDEMAEGFLGLRPIIQKMWCWDPSQNLGRTMAGA